MFKKKRKRKEHKYINGAKGAVSLFLIVLMLPFIEIASAMINIQKYNASVSILDEVVDSSMVSTLASYDSYVNKRFGLFTLDQKNDLTEQYDKYFKQNLGVLPSGFNDEYTITVKGQNTFLKDEILRAQIDEYAKYNSPILMANDFLNIDELVKQIEKAFNATDILGLIKNGADVCGGVADYAKQVDELKDISDDIYDLIDDYNSHYSSWKSNALNMAKAMRDLESEEERLEELEAALAAAQSAPPSSDDDSDDNSDYIDELEESIEDCKDNIEQLEKDIPDYKEKANDYQKKYSTSHTDIATKISEDYKPKFEEVLSTLEGLVNSTTELATGAVTTYTNKQIEEKKKTLKDVNKKLEGYKTEGENDSSTIKDPEYKKLLDQKTTLDSEITKYEIESVNASAMKSFSDAAIAEAKDCDGKLNEEAVLKLVSDLLAQKKKVDAFSISSITKETTSFPDGYYFKISVILTSEELSDLYKNFNEVKKTIGNVIKSLWEGIKGVLESLAGIKLLYDPALCSVIDTDYFMNQFGLQIDSELSGNGLITTINFLTKFVTKLTAIITDVTTVTFGDLFEGPFDFFTDLEELLNIGCDLFESFKSLATSISNFISSFADGEQFISNMFYTYYLATSLPCRTDYKSFSDIEFEDHSNWSTGIPVLSDLLCLFERVSGKHTPTSKMFAGAELEYLLAGSNDEIKNQCTVFLSIYVMRFIASLPCLFSAEVSSIAAGPQAIVVYPVYALLEPLVDTILLVSGGSVPFLKFTAYLTPSGIPNAVSQLSSLTDISENEDKMKSSFAKIIGYEGSLETPKSNYFTKLFNFKYKEYLMMIMFLFPNQTNELKLFRNLIQLETLEHHRINTPVNPNFDIRNTYTAIEVQTETKIREFMPGLISSSLFEVKRTQHRGY